jgi:hypothetical protein
MADIHIRNVDDELFRRLKVQAATEGITLKELVLRKLGFTEPAERPKPERAQSEPTPTRLNQSVRPAHQAGCKCMMCRPNR